MTCSINQKIAKQHQQTSQHTECSSDDTDVAITFFRTGRLNTGFLWWWLMCWYPAKLLLFDSGYTQVRQVTTIDQGRSRSDPAITHQRKFWHKVICCWNRRRRITVLLILTRMLVLILLLFLGCCCLNTNKAVQVVIKFQFFNMHYFLYKLYFTTIRQQ